MLNKLIQDALNKQVQMEAESSLLSAMAPSRYSTRSARRYQFLLPAI
jgi:hypothetical protein